MKILAATASLTITLLMPNASFADRDLSVTIPISVNVSASQMPEQQLEACKLHRSNSLSASLGDSRGRSPDESACESDLIVYDSIESNGQQVVLVVPL